MAERNVVSYNKGMSRSPSDFLCSDGELAECVNLEIRNEELVPMRMPAVLPFSLESGERLVMVHSMRTGVKNYFTETSGVVKVFGVEDGVKVYYPFSLNCGVVKSIQYIGNTVVVYASDSPHYILYSEGGYRYLGSKIPDVAISFDLKGELVYSDTFTVVTPDLDKGSEEWLGDVAQQLLGQVNKFVDEQVNDRNKFVYPFFVRYALRMFDGTYTGHSSPVLLMPSDDVSPLAMSRVKRTDVGMRSKEYLSGIGAIVADIRATVVSLSGSLDAWKDIITGIDIFVSKQVYTYDQNAERLRSALQYAGGSNFYGSYKHPAATGDYVSAVWNQRSEVERANEVNSPDGSYYTHFWELPGKTASELKEGITETSSFHYFATIDLGAVAEGYTSLLEGDSVVVETGQALPDDYMTHDVLNPESSFIYNGRLNISNVKRKVFGGFPLHCIVQWVKGNNGNGDVPTYDIGKYGVYVFIRSSGGGNDLVVYSGESDDMLLVFRYVFFPDPNAYKMVIVGDGCYAEIGLQEHTFLNGAYAYVPSLRITEGTYPLPELNDMETVTNKLFTSEVNNLFRFPIEGINTIGNGVIYGISAVTKPISQGQFGEYPLMAFCSDGNFALKVDEQGFYSNISPMQEDVVLGSDRISHLESGVAVVTKKGLMLAVGGDMTLLASHMDGASLDVSSLEGVFTSDLNFSGLLANASDVTDFLRYLYGSRMAYDYVLNRLFIYHPEKSYVYVYQFDNGSVSKMSMGGRRFVGSVTDYPDTILQDEEGRLYTLYDRDPEAASSVRVHGVAITRPLKLGEPVDRKSIVHLKNLSGLGGESSVRYRLYGSMDGDVYFPVTSLRGSSYVFWRIALYTYMLPSEGLSGTLLSTRLRMSHKFR